MSLWWLTKLSPYTSSQFSLSAFVISSDSHAFVVFCFERATRTVHVYNREISPKGFSPLLGLCAAMSDQQRIPRLFWCVLCRGLQSEELEPSRTRDLHRTETFETGNRPCRAGRRLLKLRELRKG